MLKNVKLSKIEKEGNKRLKTSKFPFKNLTFYIFLDKCLKVKVNESSDLELIIYGSTFIY